MKDNSNPAYQLGRISIRATTGEAVFLPKIRVLKSGVRKRVGKEFVINEPFETFLNMAIHLAERDGIIIKANVMVPQKKRGRRDPYAVSDIQWLVYR